MVLFSVYAAAGRRLNTTHVLRYFNAIFSSSETKETTRNVEYMNISQVVKFINLGKFLKNFKNVIVRGNVVTSEVQQIDSHSHKSKNVCFVCSPHEAALTSNAKGS